jgi:hypothetical protein
MPGEAKFALLECGGRLLGAKVVPLEIWAMTARRMSRKIPSNAARRPNFPKRIASTDSEKECRRNATFVSARDRPQMSVGQRPEALERPLDPFTMIAPRSAIGSSFRDLPPGGPTEELDDKTKQRTADPPAKRQRRLHWESLIPSKQSVPDTEGRTASSGRKGEVLIGEAETESGGCGQDGVGMEDGFSER